MSSESRIGLSSSTNTVWVGHENATSSVIIQRSFEILCSISSIEIGFNTVEGKASLQLWFNDLRDLLKYLAFVISAEMIDPTPTHRWSTTTARHTYILPSYRITTTSVLKAHCRSLTSMTVMPTVSCSISISQAASCFNFLGTLSRCWPF